MAKTNDTTGFKIKAQLYVDDKLLQTHFRIEHAPEHNQDFPQEVEIFPDINRNNWNHIYLPRFLRTRLGDNRRNWELEAVFELRQGYALNRDSLEQYVEQQSYEMRRRAWLDARTWKQRDWEYYEHYPHIHYVPYDFSHFDQRFDLGNYGNICQNGLVSALREALRHDRYDIEISDSPKTSYSEFSKYDIALSEEEDEQKTENRTDPPKAPNSGQKRARKDRETDK